ncbi:MAG: hypothetical protein HOP29_05815 [Phycisphaerales bacterium]|nr:hypothetical protein [Phycisphaerales bacterium]
MERRASALVEVIALFFIAGLIAAVAIPDYDVKRPEIQQKALIASLKTVRSAIDRYWADHGASYPSLEALESLDGAEPTVGPPSDMEVYLRHMPANPFTRGNRVGLPSAPVGTTDWVYDPATGVFKPNDAEERRAL